MYQHKYYKSGPYGADRSDERFKVNTDHMSIDDSISPLKHRQLSLRNDHDFESVTREQKGYKVGQYSNRTDFNDDEMVLRVNNNIQYANRSAAETWDYTEDDGNFEPDADYFNNPDNKNMSNYGRQKGTYESGPRTRGIMQRDQQGHIDKIGTGNVRTEANRGHSAYIESDRQRFVSDENRRAKPTLFYTSLNNKVHATYLQGNEAETSFINVEDVTQRNQTPNATSNDGQGKTNREIRDSIMKLATNQPSDYVGRNYVYKNDTRNIREPKENVGLSRENSAYLHPTFDDITTKYNETDATTTQVVRGIQQYRYPSMIPSEYSIYSPSTQHIDTKKTRNSICSFVLLISCSMVVLLNGIVDGYMNYQIGNLTCNENSYLTKRFNFNTSLTDVCEQKDLVDKIVRGVYSVGSVLTCLQIVNIIVTICHRVKLSSVSGMSGLAELQLAIWLRDIPQTVIALLLSFPCTCGEDSRPMVTLVIVGGFVVCWFRFLTSFPSFKGESGLLNLWWRCLCCKESSRDIEDVAYDGSEKASCDVPCFLCCFTWHLQKSKCRIQCWCFDIFKRLHCIFALCDKDRTKYGHRLMSLFGLTLLTLILAAQIFTLL